MTSIILSHLIFSCHLLDEVAVLSPPFVLYHCNVYVDILSTYPLSPKLWDIMNGRKTLKINSFPVELSG